MIKSLLIKLLKKNSHITAWLGYGIYFYVLNRLTNDEFTWTQVWFTLPFLALIFYVVLFILMRFYEKGKVGLTFLLLLVFYLLMGIVIYVILYQIGGVGLVQGRYIVQDPEFSRNEYIQSVLVVLGNFTIFAILYYHRSKAFNEIKKRYETEKLKNKFEYVSLAGQVSPHLMANLFAKWENDFDNREGSSVKELRQAYQMMVFYMDANAFEKRSVVLLEDEVNQLESYRDMLMASSDHPKYIDLNCSGNLDGKAIPPTTLICLLENASKYGVVHDPENPIIVNMEASDQGIRIECQNRKASEAVAASHGIGLYNLKRRLELYYESAVSFNIREREDYYHVIINIQS